MIYLEYSILHNDQCLSLSKEVIMKLKIVMPFFIVFVLILTIGSLFVLLQEKNVYPSEKPIWQAENDPNPAMQFKCVSLNYDFKNCRNWFIDCWSSKLFNVKYCVQLNYRPKLNWNRK